MSIDVSIETYHAFVNMDISLVPDMEVEDTRTKIINFI